MISPEQQAYGTIRRLCHEAVDVEVYDFNPPAETPYPFVRIGEQMTRHERITKQLINGDTDITIHFWHNDVYQRGTLTSMMYAVEQAIIEEFGARGEGITSQVIDDNTTGSTLLHGILEVTIKRYKQ